MTPLALSRELLVGELQTASGVLDKWVQRFKGAVPGVDSPAPPEDVLDYFREFQAELSIVSAKCDALVSLLNADIRG